MIRGLTALFVLLAVGTVPVPREMRCDPNEAPAGWRTWRVADLSFASVRAEHGPDVAVLLVEHRAPDGRSVIAGWWEDRLVLFEDAPGVRLMLYNARVMGYRWIFAQPRPGCEWRRFEPLVP